MMASVWSATKSTKSTKSARRQGSVIRVKNAQDLIPWKVTNIPLRPHDGMWTMNPSVHFDGKLWICVLRCSDYAMPGGVTIRGSKASASGTQTKNAMVILDPDTWQVAQVFKMQERDGMPRVQCANVGYEDMRLFKTDSGGLQGIAACLHLDRGKMDVGRPEGATNHQPPEQVLIDFDGEYNIVKVKPIRGTWWSSKAQKNWAPFDHAEAPRFLYAIDRGTMFDDNGAIEGTALVTPSSSRVLKSEMSEEMREQREREERDKRERHEREQLEQRERQEREEREHREREERDKSEREQQDRERAEREKRERDRRTFVHGRAMHRGAEVKTVRGRTVAADTVLSRPSTMRGVRRAEVSSGNSKQVVSAGRALPPRYAGLRGGSQLVHVGDDRWLGIGHEMNFNGGSGSGGGRKNYWHLWYLTDKHGKVTAVSDPMKLVPNGGIEFAAGMAIDGDRVVVSFGVDDMESKIGETSLSAVLAIVHPA